MRPVMHRLLLVLVPLLAGCTALDLNLADFGREVDSTGSVSDIICLWEPAEGVGMDGLPTRGFAGQILFFARGQAEPVKVNGDVRVYVFDDQGTTEEQSRPLHEFNFPPDAWNIYLSKSNLGNAYQVFIPYTRKGGLQSNCALRVRLTAGDRPPVYSKLANVSLRGRVAATPAKEVAAAVVPQAEAGPNLEALIQQAAVQRASVGMGAGKPNDRLRRLQEAADATVQTAAYETAVTNGAGEGEGAESAHFEVEEPSSRRYRMSKSVNSQ